RGFIGKRACAASFNMSAHWFEVPLRSTPMERLSSNEKFLLCFAKTGVNTPGTILPNSEFTSFCKLRAGVAVEPVLQVPSNKKRAHCLHATQRRDRKSTRLNSSHLVISYAVFCLKK